MTHTYPKTTCPFCGRQISIAGLPYTNHMRGHVARGEAVEYKEQGRYKYRTPKIAEKKQ